MATKTNITNPPAQEYDPWQDMKQVFVPSHSRSEQKTLEVGVNDKTYFVPKDQFVDVPAPVAEIIEERERRLKEYEQNAKNASGIREK